jgi:putative PIN family toxin of toxin-antitoxin system
MTIRVVIDTNILVSALLTPQGAPAEVILMCLYQPDFQLGVSGPVFAEYDDVIRRPRLHRTEYEIESTLAAIRERSLWVKPAESVRACTDPADDIFLECAQAVSAQFLVTGNSRHFPLSWKSTQIVSARLFLDTVL